MKIQKENQILKDLLKSMIKGEKPLSLTYEAIHRDDIETLQLLIDGGIDIKNNNFVFTALDNRAFKCLDLLIEKGASLTYGGRAFNGSTIIYVEPLELACVNRQLDIAKKLVANGAPLKTFAGVNVLKKYQKFIGEEHSEELKKIAKDYELAYSDKSEEELDK